MKTIPSSPRCSNCNLNKAEKKIPLLNEYNKIFLYIFNYNFNGKYILYSPDEVCKAVAHSGSMSETLL